MTNDEIDSLAADLPGLTLHGQIPTATTMAFAARIVELNARVESLEKVESAYHELRNALFEMTHETDTRTIDQLVNGDLAIAAEVALMKWHVDEPDQRGKGGS